MKEHEEVMDSKLAQVNEAMIESNEYIAALNVSRRLTRRVCEHKTEER